MKLPVRCARQIYRAQMTSGATLFPYGRALMKHTLAGGNSMH
ncbi:MAG: hypothetical protein SOY93_00930 [Elusimicrobiaceae bacterium]|nr:hypothetical protein [Elusimicrobiaceae bacterium]